MGAAHAKQNLPRDLADVRPLFILPPSMIVLTGFGAHCYWILKEIWTFDSEIEMQRAAALAARWCRALQARAATRSWSVDSVHDLSRVMRVAGTLNRKCPPDIRPVRVAEYAPDVRYCVHDLEKALDLEGTEAVSYADIEPPRQGQRANLPAEYDAAASAPREKLEALLMNDPTFRMTWQRRRLDMLDQSASAYDMAVANALALVKWTNVEIVGALIERRRIHNETDFSKFRDTYFGPTLARARQNAARFWGENQ